LAQEAMEAPDRRTDSKPFSGECMRVFYSRLNALQVCAFSHESITHTSRVILADFLSRYVGKSRGEIADFARRVGVSPGQITNVLRGRRLPGVDVLLGWTDALPEEARDDWRLVAYLAHTPQEIRTLFDRARTELAGLRQDLAALSAENARLRAQLTKKPNG
jgi:transcriptional regulator with XRE-family HTH domain